MSDRPGNRYDKKEEFQILLTKNDPLETPHHKNYMWMARWTKASSSVEPPNDSSCKRLEGLNKGTGTNDGGILTSEFMKSAVAAERLMLGVNHGSSSVQYSRRFSSNMRGLVHDVCNELGPKNYRHRDESFEGRIRQKAVNLHAKVAMSETYSLRRLSELPLDLQKLESSYIQSSDWNHFPKFEINRKIDNILNPKRRSALGPGSMNANLSSSHVMELSAQEYMIHSDRINDENMDIHKPTGGISTRLEGVAGLSSDPSGQKLKGHLSDTMSCSCSKANNSSDCQIDEQHTTNYVADSKHELPFAASGKALHFVGNEKDKFDASAFHNLQSRRAAVCKQQDAAEDIFRAPVLSTEFRKEPTDCSYKSKQGGEDFDRTFKSYGKDISLLPYEQQHLKTQRTESAAALNLPPDADTLTGTSKQVTHEKESTKKSEVSCERKGPCPYEMLTTAPKSQSTCPKNSVSLGNGFDVCMYGTNIGSRLFGTQNQSSARTETLYSDTLIVSKSSADIASLLAQKDCAYPNEAKNEPPENEGPPTRRDLASRENGNESHNLNEHPDVFSKATIASKQSCITATGTTNLDLMLFQMSRMRNPISVGVVQRPVGYEASDRWLKRLHPDVVDPEIHTSKRQKVGGSPPHEDLSYLFGMALHYNRTDNEESIKRIKENKVPDEGIKLHDDQRLHVPAKTIKYWVGRWCESGTPVFHGDPGQRRQATQDDQASEELGGQFPSIAAMAMMGRAMNKLRPCEHQKKGPFVVWKTE